jgi:hypothetical protein
LKIAADPRQNPRVFRNRCQWVLVLGAFLLLALPARAAPRDGAAQKKMEEAIYTHFLNMDFDKAEGLLVGTFRACEDKCSTQVRAKLWMYAGIVRGSGRQDLAGAEEAFVNAFAEDPNVALDRDIAPPEVQQVFDKARAKAGSAPAAAAATATGGMTCSLKASEVQSRRPIPVECEADKDLDSAELYYENYKVKWTSVKMTAKDGVWRGTIPCTVTQNTGKLRWYVEGYSDDEDVLASLGDEDSPQELEVVDQTSEEPPAFPDEDPPPRCGVSDEPARGECGGWGASCGDGGCCETGLMCVDGTCEQAECERNSDCDSGTCKRGKCQKGDPDDYAKNYLGLHFGFDIASITSPGACSPASRTNDSFTCVRRADGSAYDGFPNENFAGTVGGGFVPATMRLMASYERLIGPVGLEGRVGFAFGGGPNLLPAHVELKAKYWFTGTAAFSRPGVRVYAHLGGGMAQVDATVPVDVLDCTDAPNPAACVEAERDGTVLQLDATKQLGLSFIQAGGGLMYAVGASHGPVLNVNAMMMLPASGFVLQPSLGYTVGF